jgi:hypothetical protein
MSTDDKDEILTHLRSLRGLLNWLGGGLFFGMMGVAAVLAQDHFEQREIKADLVEMKPRVERLWYEWEIRRGGHQP